MKPFTAIGQIGALRALQDCTVLVQAYARKELGSFFASYRLVEEMQEWKDTSKKDTGTLIGNDILRC